MAKISKDQGWYKLDTPAGHTYTPFPTSRHIWEAAPESITELVNLLNTGKELHSTGKLVYRYDDTKALLKSSELPNGCYLYRDTIDNEVLVPFKLRNETFITTNKVVEKMTTLIEQFIANEEVYRKMGTMYKLGLLLYGPPGNSKSSVLRQVINTRNNDFITIFFEKDFPSDQFLVKIKETLESRMKFFVFEELTSNLHDEFISRLLTFLDGELSVDKSIILATTNYPEKLPGNIVNRPSRFDKLFEFDFPNDQERAALLKHFLGRKVTPEEVLRSKDLSVADLKEVALFTAFNKTELLVGIKEVKDRASLCKRVFKKSTNMGFGE